MVNWNNSEEVKQYYRENYQKKKERKSGLMKIWRENNKDKVKSGKKKWVLENRESKRKSNKKWRDNNKEKIKADRKRDANKIKVAWKIWSSKNNDKIKKNKKEYYLLNKKKIIKNRKLNYLNNKNNKCLICGKPSNNKYCSIQCCGINNSGEKCVLWRGGLSFEKYGINWNNKFKQMIRKRDNHICKLCTQPQEVFNRTLSVHHIDGNKKNSVKENCISLCDFCHQCVEKDKIKKKNYYEPLFYKMLKKLYNY